MRLGEILRKWRIVQERTVRDLAGEIGISPSTLSRIERGEVMDAMTFMQLLGWLTERPVQPEVPAAPVQESLL